MWIYKNTHHFIRFWISHLLSFPLLEAENADKDAAPYKVKKKQKKELDSGSPGYGKSVYEYTRF